MFEVLIFTRKTDKTSKPAMTIRDLENSGWICTRSGVDSEDKNVKYSELALAFRKHARYLSLEPLRDETQYDIDEAEKETNELKTQFLCYDTNKFIEELKELINKYTSDGGGLDVSIKVKSFS